MVHICFSEYRWLDKNLSYIITKYPSTLKRAVVDKEIQRAFDVWSEYTDLTFTPKRENVNIEIRFEYGQHGDSRPFKRNNGVLGHVLTPVSRNTTCISIANKLKMPDENVYS